MILKILKSSIKFFMLPIDGCSSYKEFISYKRLLSYFVNFVYAEKTIKILKFSLGAQKIFFELESEWNNSIILLNEIYLKSWLKWIIII